MPKKIAEKDKTNIYCAYKLGEVNNVTKFTNPVMLRGQFVSLIGNKRSQYYGINMAYDGIIIFEDNPSTQYIDEFCKFWVGVEPESGAVSAEYKTDKIVVAQDGLKTVYVYKQTENAHNLWCLYEDGNIYKINVNLIESDNEDYKYKAVIPSNMYVRIDRTTKIWYEEPIDANDTTSLLQLSFVEQDKFDVSYYLKEVI